MHAKQARGTKSVYLKAKVNAKKKKTMHAKGAVRHWDVKMSNVSTPFIARKNFKRINIVTLTSKLNDNNFISAIDP